jgi:AraC family transcriptional regulator of adaptative response/methylated-DNA-[protein]-cysteine methyltransferase
MSPSKFRNGGQGLAICYATAECFLGFVVVAATDRGICAIEFGADPEALYAQLRRQFPKAEILAAGENFASTVGAVMRKLENPAESQALPLDIQGTAFQQRVWNALRDIGPGKTASYAEVARRIGHPKAARAVAAACRANPVAVVVPCHRVVGAEGDLRGYRWGVERKRELLRREQTTRSQAEPPLARGGAAAI